MGNTNKRWYVIAVDADRIGGARACGGFTLLEVMISLLIATVGVMGAVAMQQTVLISGKNSNDGIIAMRLGETKSEQINNAQTIAAVPPTPLVDELAAYVAATTGTCPNLHCQSCTGGWCDEPVNDAGEVAGASNNIFRWRRQWQVLNAGIGQPYNIAVRVSYNIDNPVPRSIEVDSQRFKGW
jgi:prepilin-type N-terminal cleavage/methylation domain-containing protein